jgi:hypothetical protein
MPILVLAVLLSGDIQPNIKMMVVTHWTGNIQRKD